MRKGDECWQGLRYQGGGGRGGGWEAKDDVAESSRTQMLPLLSKLLRGVSPSLPRKAELQEWVAPFAAEGPLLYAAAATAAPAEHVLSVRMDACSRRRGRSRRTGPQPMLSLCTKDHSGTHTDTHWHATCSKENTAVQGSIHHPAGLVQWRELRERELNAAHCAALSLSVSLRCVLGVHERRCGVHYGQA